MMGNPRLVLCAFFVVAAGCVGDPSQAGDGSDYYTGAPPPAGDDGGSGDGSSMTPPDDTGSDSGSGDTAGSGDTGRTAADWAKAAMARVNAGQAPTAATPPADASAVNLLRPTPDNARLAYLMLASLGA